jgi:hypothetical protein
MPAPPSTAPIEHAPVKQPANAGQKGKTMLSALSELPSFILGVLGFAAGVFGWYAARHGVPWTWTKLRNLWAAASNDVGSAKAQLAALQVRIAAVEASLEAPAKAAVPPAVPPIQSSAPSAPTHAA